MQVRAGRDDLIPRIFDCFSLITARAQTAMTTLFNDLADTLKDMRAIFLHASYLAHVSAGRHGAYPIADRVMVIFAVCRKVSMGC